MKIVSMTEIENESVIYTVMLEPGVFVDVKRTDDGFYYIMQCGDGYMTFEYNLDIITFLSSSGPLNTSNVFLLNSGNSSKNNTPLCAKLISPGFGILPPPIIEVCDIV